MNKTKKVQSVLAQLLTLLFVFGGLTIVCLKCSEIGENEIVPIYYQYSGGDNQKKVVIVDSVIELSDVLEKGGTVVRYQDTVVNISIPSNATLCVSPGQMMNKGQQIANAGDIIYSCSVNGRMLDSKKEDDGNIKLAFDAMENYEIVVSFSPWLYTEVATVLSSGNYQLLMNGQTVSAELHSFGFDEQNNLLRLIFRELQADDMLFDKAGVKLIGELSEATSYILFPRECVKAADEIQKTITVARYDEGRGIAEDLVLPYCQPNGTDNDKYWVENDRNLVGAYLRW